jgi:8-oxo-dGTP pyrophosphatase MutT (NUDIX family)
MIPDVSSGPGDPFPAATVIVLRHSTRSPFKVLMVKRNDSVAFMAGAFVFPGGRVDPADREVTVKWSLVASGASRFGDLTPGREWPYRIAAARELAEEADVRVDPEHLVPVAHWVTPEGEPRRYDTRFFIAMMPEGQRARFDAGETVALEWMAPGEATERCMQGDIRLPPPTWTLLKRLSGFPTLEAAVEWARSTPIVRILPNLVRSDGPPMLTLPGDPLHPAPPGWEPFDDTRFVLHQDQGWRPTKA